MTATTGTAVVVLAAGAGTRMKSDTPKVLHTLAGRSMLAHALHAVAKVAPEHLVVVVGKDRERVIPAVEALAAELGRPVATAVQEQQLGTGHAVECGLSALPDGFAGTVVVTSGDVPLLDADTLAELIDTHTSGGPAAATLLTTTLSDPTGYGRILRTQDGEVIGIVEQADATPSQRAITEVNAGVYAFDATALRPALSRLRSDNAQGEQYLTDVIGLVRADGRTVRAVHVADTMLVAGVNDRVQLAELSAELNRRIVAAHQRAGVTVIDPATTWIDVDVTIGRDTVVRPGTQLLGATRIGGRCEIGPDTTLTDVTVGDGASVVRTHGSEAVIGDGATVGPFTYLRPGTALGADGKLGAFVETKNATIGTGTKVPHLTYVGDADIGEYSNIGASSVFVNYDGETKSRTRIGSHVRTGSDTMFVAPVTIGDGAYTGAGTVVREDVPPGALAVSAGPQRNIEGWVARKRPGSKSAAAAAAAASDTAAAAERALADAADEDEKA
ncbi:bifunctional N-acetylglucosamine-1-phosphate uridyltransferase/glucosamine-1-phosphate acetyltransferase [Mycolicibacterium phlei]|jgi:bifunctional UDP-N-acetylglucosamine pyrophosphorylase/glucosamine-1-phosphate N-acetyltransferase|uniref:bifunctional UDP-N-acetylglucosamine diphosphorylase/glucosamine-1-phosphate N-acetyltransferase GlmU n=1 Tax=Mycolicibacterium phlei TaxID=1771 RepID=UPI00025AE589|nr:bifunctional UDP-N-acetylglucosamine diphosphorylase/glucosamine-1-phosphate N-acetyltransferase GlmU [Mycolicibacterium phlei]VEG11245.1 bifunctional N-acetylglucosamine-1-phosphate uridyltransferase/glucosamine-1-phosphate acetyltransferase [Mycobacteroides chelonae]AMO63148.1 Bifunctional protein GlmU [Mycolicibacterium phlei]EID09639.1 bifunctional N-acetylglucosamine-1-phosphate uridyltransferase/glucosamine-1-phosphate acetyltransferase [Mycolicibacterium phlei RIVM601174]KXW64352.1 N-